MRFHKYPDTCGVDVAFDFSYFDIILPFSGIFRNLEYLLKLQRTSDFNLFEERTSSKF